MDLHRHQGVPDYQLVATEDRNIYQHIAAGTFGIVTPGNAASSFGLGITLSGVQDIHQDSYIKGAAKIIIGSSFDFVDGRLAEWSGTKSPLGEAVDATFDKVAIFAILAVMAEKEMIPKERIALFGIQNAVNTGASIAAKQKGIELRSSKYGKITSALQRVSIGASFASAAFRSRISDTVPESDKELTRDTKAEYIASKADTLAKITAYGANILGAIVSVNYLNIVISKSK